MSIQTQLFEGQRIRFTPFDYDQDPEIESQWTHTPAYLRMLGAEIVRPLTVEQVKKKYEEIEKEVDEKRKLFYFAIRARNGAEDQKERLIGFARLFWIEWSIGSGNVQLGIGNPKDWGQGYGNEALGMLLRFSFNELNLFRLTAVVPDYNQAACHLFEKAGFLEEVRRREALRRGGRRWDMVHFGILRPEWQARSDTTANTANAA